MSKAKDKPAVAGKTGTPIADSKALTLHGKDEAERKTAMAGAFTSSSLNSARIVVGYNTGNTIDLMAAINALVAHQKELSAGDMSRAEKHVDESSCGVADHICRSGAEGERADRINPIANLDGSGTQGTIRMPSNAAGAGGA